MSEFVRTFVSLFENQTLLISKGTLCQ